MPFNSSRTVKQSIRMLSELNSFGSGEDGNLPAPADRYNVRNSVATSGVEGIIIMLGQTREMRPAKCCPRSSSVVCLEFMESNQVSFMNSRLIRDQIFSVWQNLLTQSTSF